MLESMYGWYLNQNIKFLIALNRIITSVAVALRMVKIRLEIKAKKLRTRRDEVVGVLQIYQEESIPKIWYQCSGCGSVTDVLPTYCPAGCGEVVFNKVRLEFKDIQTLRDMNRVWSVRPSLFPSNPSKRKSTES